MKEKKTYYDVLDGLRGVAALAVMFFHYCEMVFWPNYEAVPIGHGFLAVDFFFCLSGFVIAFAYDGRIREEGNKKFIINRLIRLHPMVVIGGVLGIISYLANPYMDITIGMDKIITAFILSLFLIPYPWMQYREGELFPFNTPTWSLFFEYIANIAYLLLLSKLSRRVLLVLWVLSIGFLVFCAQRSGWLINGWGIDFISDGFARVSYSFIAGMLIYRFKLIWKNQLGLIIPSLLLLLALIVPHATNDWILECILVIICFPVIISLGAGAKATGFMRKICTFLGRLSYPLYLTHITLVTLFNSYYRVNGVKGMELALTVFAFTILNILLAYLVMRFYDEPVRKWLMNRMRGR